VLLSGFPDLLLTSIFGSSPAARGSEICGVAFCSGKTNDEKIPKDSEPNIYEKE